MNFSPFKHAVQQQFQRMTHDNKPLYTVAVDKDELWNLYLKSFPPGSNLIVNERTEHDCQACRHFIRDMGAVIAFSGDVPTSLWDVGIDDPAYQTVATALADYVRRKPIANIFLTTEKAIGVDKNLQQTAHGIKTWEHFYVRIPASYVLQDRSKSLAEKLGELRTTHDVLLRGLEELSEEALTTVIGLIQDKALYRGEEHASAVESFYSLHRRAARLTARRRDHMVWQAVPTIPPSVSRFRNTVIGTLVQDLSEGMDLERAVAAFESKVAPQNYKRTTALVTPRMLEQAKQELVSLGLLPALERRFAIIHDLTINNVLFADRSIRHLNADVFDTLKTETSRQRPTKTDQHVETVTIEDFLTHVLPKVHTMEVLVENRHVPRLVSLVAPCAADAPRLFTWDNPFSWSYNGAVTDSIKERVKKAGGNITGDFCCRLAWYNYDDLDLHMHEPGGGHIFYGTRLHRSPCGGQLDVDMNVSPTTREPVENIYYSSRRTMRPGPYTLSVHSYTHREQVDVGFDIEIDFLGTPYSFSYPKMVRPHETVQVAVFEYAKDGTLTIVESLPMQSRSQHVWGLTTETFVPVQTLCYSPNYWDGHGVGNKHYFFMLQGCTNDGTARGFYNEFLRSELTTHRKSMELVGSRMTLAPQAEQLSGLGFSSTQHTDLLCRVRGGITRTFKILF